MTLKNIGNSFSKSNESRNSEKISTFKICSIDSFNKEDNKASCTLISRKTIILTTFYHYSKFGSNLKIKHLAPNEDE